MNVEPPLSGWFLAISPPVGVDDLLLRGIGPESQNA